LQDDWMDFGSAEREYPTEEEYAGMSFD